MNTSWLRLSLRRRGRSNFVAFLAFVIFLIAARPFPASAGEPAKKASEPATAPATAPAVSGAKAAAPATLPAVSKALLRVAKAAPAVKPAAAPAPQSATPAPRIWLDQPKPVPATYVGTNTAGTKSATKATSGHRLPGDGGGDPGGVPPAPPAPPAGILGQNATPLALASADFNEDGYNDLAAGYAASAGGGIIAIHRGNIDAFAPQSDASFQAIAHGQFPSPFLANVQVFSVPVTPDFIAAGKFSGSGHQDLIIAARGGNALYILPGDGTGNFGAPQMVDLPGGVTTLAAGNLGTARAFTSLLVGIAVSSQQSVLVVLKGSDLGLTTVNVLALEAPASSIAYGNLDGDFYPDAAILAGGEVFILHGANGELERISLPVSPSAMALGSFVFDRDGRVQMALLTPDGTVHIAVHASFDPHKFTPEENALMHQEALRGESNTVVPAPLTLNETWKIVESFPGTPLSSSQLPLLLRTRISGNSADDVMVLNPLSGQMVLISHPNLADDAPTFVPGQVSVRPYSASPVAALPMRNSIDARPGIIALHQGETAPQSMVPLPDPTFTVNTTSDILNTGATPCASATPGQCSLRQAIFEANAAAGADVIMVPAGTYQLTITNATANGENADLTGDLDITDALSIIGAVDGSGNPTTIIQAGTIGPSGAADGIDKVLSVNPLFNKAFDTSFSNLVIRFGFNHASAGTNGFGGGFDWEADGTGNMTVTNCIITDNQTTDGEGGGITATNKILAGTGVFTISNSTVQNNVAKRAPAGAAGIGGGIFIGNHTAAHITNVKVLNNQIPQANGIGGGIAVIGPSSTGAGQTTIHGSTIQGNTSAGTGGGINTGAGILIDQGTLIDGNTASLNGGGLWNNDGNPETTTLSHVTITGNHANGGHGGGIRVDSNTPNNLTISFSRLAGNTANTGGSNLSNLAGAVTATDNWWGIDTPATTIEALGGTTTSSPFITLTHTASPNKIRINQSTTLTASFLQDSNNSPLTTAQIDQLLGLPITFNNAVDGSISGAQTTIQSTGPGAGTATATFNAGNVAGGGKADAVVDQATVTANIIVLQPPSIAKSFSPAVIKVNGTSTITFQITNPNVVTINASFTDDLTSGATVSGLVVAATPNVSNGCGGSVTANAGANSISFLNAALPVSGSPCTITVDVTGTSDGIKPNSVTIDSTDAGNGNTASANPSLKVINPPTINKVFGASTIPLNGTTSVTFTITNPNANAVSVLNGISFTDNLPNAAPGTLVVANPNGLTNTCSTTPTATAGSGSISLTGASLAAGASCTISVNVQGTVAGLAPNSVTVSDTVAGTGNTSSTSLIVVAPPTISKSFSPKSVPLNSNSTLSFTLTNPNTGSALSGIAFTDSLPGGVKLASTTVTGSCGSGTITATINNPPGSPSTVSLSGGTLTASPAAGSSCTFSVSVTGITAGAQVNTTSTVSSTEGGTGSTASDTLIVVAPPTISKSFSPKTIPLNSNSTLSFTVTNPNTASALSGVAFTDSLPGGVKLASTTVTGSCGSGTITATINNPPGTPSTVSLSGGTLTASPAVGSSCTFSVSVTGISAGSQVNTTSTVSATEGGTGGTATDTLTVIAPPTISKSFSPKSIPLNGNSTLSFTLTNPNTVSALSGVAFTDSLPGGVKLASTTVTGTCGSGTITATINNPPGTPSTVSLSGGTLTASPDPASSCTFSVSVTGISAGAQVNTTSTVSATEGGTGGTATDTLTVIAPPTIAKSFAPKTIPKNGNSTLSFTLTNPNTASALSGVSFTDTLPGGVKLASTTVTGSCGSGTITATINNPPGTPSTVSLSGGTLTASPAAGSSCTFSVSITGITEGSQVNTTSTVSSTEGGTGGTATDTLTVVAPPTISKAFGATNISLNGTTTVTFTITNPATNTTAENGIAFSDTLTNGLQVASTPGVTNSCGGTVTAAANTTSISLTGGSIATPGSTCTIVVNVTGTQSGTVTNTTGAISSTNGGTGATSNTATLIVASPATVTKTFAPTKIALNGTTLLTINITNPNSNVSLTGLSFTDSLPAGLVIASPANLNNTCGGTATATAGSGSLSLSGGTLASSASCAVSVNVQGTTAGDKINSVTVSSTEGGASSGATATVTVVAPPTISKAFNPTSIAKNGTSTITFTISNPNNPGTPANGDLTGVAFSDTLPVSGGAGSATLVVSGTPNVSNTCGGTVTATAGSGVISLSGGSVAHNTSCTLSVDVKGTVEGDGNNTTGAISSTEGGTGTTSNTATLKVVAPPTISKAFGATNITLNGTTTVTFTITNPASNTSAENGIAFSDTLTNGLQVASTPGVTNSCGGTVTAAANTTSISLTGGSIATPGSTCTIVVNVTGTQSGTVTNTTGAVSSTNGGTGNTSNTAQLIVAAPATVTKTFAPTKIALNGTTLLTINITNPNSNVSLTGLSFTDSLPAGLIVASPSNLNNTCGGTATATVGSGSLSLSGGTLASSASCAVSVNVQGTTAGDKLNSVTVSSTEGGASSGATATVTVVAPATISKAFNPTSIARNGTSTITFTISNPNNPGTPANGDLTGVAFSDTLPVSGGAGSATLVVSSTPNVSNTCGGTVTATAGSGVISLSGGSVAHNTSCTLSVDVKGTVEGDGNNTTGAISSTEGGTGTTSNTATLKVVAPPTISKAFGAANITLNGTTTVTFTITNPASNTSAENGIAFSDTLTNGLQVASTPGVTNSCGGTVTAAANTTSISLVGGSIATPGSTCTIVVNVTGTQSGTVTNTTGAVSSTNGGTGATSNTATLIVASPPTVTKTFAPTKIALNGTTLLTINITNPNSNVSLTGLSFTDSLPAGLVIASPANLNNTCGGTATATAGSGSVSLSGGTLASSASCAVSVNVQGTTAGDKINSVTVSSTEGGASSGATATVTVVAPPTISKAFNPTSIAKNGTSTITFTISNPNNPGTPANGDLTGVAFSDTLPVSGGAGSATLVVSSTPNVSNTCGGTVTATAGSGVISLSGGSVAHNTSCTLSVDVKGTVEGDGNNTTGAISSTEGGTGTTSNTATLKVVAPPTISKAFGAANITLNGTTTVTFTITNPASNTSAENGIAFSDTLTNGLQVASTPGVTNSCGGTVTAAANTTSISLVGGSIATPGSTCTIVVNVTGTQSGTVTNTTGAVSSTNGGTGATSNTATLTVALPPTITKSFNPISIALNPGGTAPTSSVLSFTINNPNTNVALNGVAFTDNLPVGLAVATPNGLTGSCGSGTITATAGSGVVSLSGGTLAATASCTFSVNVIGLAASVNNNSVTVTSTEGGTGNTSNATLTVVAPPGINKVFGAASIPVGGTTTLQFNISNGNSTTTLTGIGFTDTLPAGLVVATPNGLTGNTCSTTPTAVAGSNSVSLSGASLNQGASCTFFINVTGTAGGTKHNATSQVTSNEGGTGTTASANIDVVGPPLIAKAFGATGIPLNGTTSLTFTITNPAANGVQENGVAFTDTLPTGLVVATPNGLVGNCNGGTVTAVAGTTAISLSGGTIPINSTCTITVNVTGNAPGNYTNTTGPVSSANGGTGNTATANLSVAQPPSIVKAFGATTIPQNSSTSLSFTITNPAINTIPLTVAFTDTLPAGLVVATPNGLTNTCGGTVTATAGSGSVSLSGGTVAINSTCTLTVNITGTTAGVKNNSVQVTSTQGGAGNTSNASITVVAPPSIGKAFGVSTLPVGSTTSLTLTINNPNAGVTLTGVAVTDNMPFGLNVDVPSGSTNTCGGTVTLNPHSFSLSGGTLAPSANCTVTVTVRAVAGGGTRVNTTGNVTSANGGTGNTATASITVPGPPLNIALTVTGGGNVTINPGDTATFVFTVNSGDPALGAINFSCNTPQPAGATCTFDNQGETQSTVQVTMSFTTTAPSGPTKASNQPQPGRGAAPPYAALLLPVFGVVGLLQFRRGRKGRNLRLRLALWLGGLVLLLALAGCGGNATSLLSGGGHGGGTPAGLYPITVTATSSAQPSVTATANVTVTVR